MGHKSERSEVAKYALAERVTIDTEKELRDGSINTVVFIMFMKRYEAGMTIPLWQRILRACDDGEKEHPNKTNEYAEVRHYASEKLKEKGFS